MSRTFGSVALAIFGALCLAGLRYYFHVQQQQREMDAFVTAKLSHDLPIPLDCPPLGRQNVTFNVEDSTPDLTGVNMPQIVEQWGNIWLQVYQRLQSITHDWKQEEKDMLLQKVKITVWLPAATMADDTAWSMEYDCADGYFTIDFKGFKIDDAQFE
jgi:hypothetical protein